MAVLRPFDLSHLYESAESYKRDLAALEYVSAEIGKLHDEIKMALNNNTPGVAIEEKMQTYLTLIKQREYLHHAVAQAEKNLEHSIDMLSELEHVKMPDGKHIRVVKRDDILHAQVYVLDEADRVQETIVLEMASRPEDVAKVQGIVNDLHAHMAEQLKDNVYDVDDPVHDGTQLHAEIERDVKRLEMTNEKIGLFAEFKNMIVELNEKLAPYIGRAKEMATQFAEYVKNKFQVLKVSVNEWGQYNLGEYRSVRRSFDSLNQLEKDYKEYVKLIDETSREREEVSNKIAEVNKKMDTLQRGKGLGNLFVFNKNKKWEQLYIEHQKLSHEHKMLTMQIEKMKMNLNTLRLRHIDALSVDTIDMTNKTVGPYTIQVQRDKDGIGIVLSYHGKPYEQIYLPIEDKRPMAVRMEELERFNKAVRSMSPRSIDERSSEQSIDPELEQYVQNKKNTYTNRIRNIMSELEKAPNATVAREKMKELIETAQDYSSYSNHACDMYMDAEGNFNLDFVDQNQNKLHETFLVKMDPEIGKEVMNVAYSMSNVNDKIYTVDQTQEFGLTSSVYMKQYKQLAERYIESNDMEGLKRLNDTMVGRMTSLGQMTIGNAVVTVVKFGDGFKLNVHTPGGRPQVIVCPVGLDGKIEMEQFADFVDHTMNQVREINVYDRIQGLQSGSAASVPAHEVGRNSQEQDIENTRNAPSNIYETISSMDIRKDDSKEKEQKIEERHMERV